MPYRVLAYKGWKNSDGEGKYEVIREYTPCKRRIELKIPLVFFRERRGYCKYKWFNINFPYIVFYWTDPKLYVAFSKSPIKSKKDIVYFPTITNIWGDWSMCGCGSYRSSFGISALPECIKKFWETTFTYDIPSPSLITTFGGISAYIFQKLVGDAMKQSIGITQAHKNWSKLKSKQVLKKLHHNPITFEQFTRKGWSDLHLTLEAPVCRIEL